jgi:hypothetical protein
MPKFRVRLESPDMMRDDGSPHVRVTSLTADSEEDARRWCEEKEAAIVAHRYSSAEFARLEGTETEHLTAGTVVPGALRGRLAAHRQSVPYEIVEVESVGEQGTASRKSRKGT